MASPRPWLSATQLLGRLWGGTVELPRGGGMHAFWAPGKFHPFI